jgi:predicted amino acid-binding ACT domain protein
MPVEMVLTIISQDRPGLVQTLAQVIADHSGNWIDSSMARLGGEFAGILRVDVSERTIASFEKSLAALAEHGIAVTVRRDSAVPVEELNCALCGGPTILVLAQSAKLIVRSAFTLSAMSRHLIARQSGAHPDADLPHKSGAQATVSGYQISIFSPFWLR